MHWHHIIYTNNQQGVFGAVYYPGHNTNQQGHFTTASVEHWLTQYNAAPPKDRIEDDLRDSAIILVQSGN